MLYYFLFSETSPSSPSTAVSSGVVESAAAYGGPGVAMPLNDGNSLDIAADLRGATGGSLDVYVQYSVNSGRSWYDLAHFPQIASGAPLIYFRAPVSLYTNSVNTSQVGKNLAPALAPSAMVNGAFGDRVRLVMVAGAGTSVGAPVVVGVTAQREFPRARTG